jgi:hypothetical protein
MIHEGDCTLEHIKDIISKYSSTKAMFNDESILSEIDSSKSFIKSEILAGNIISNRLLDLSKQIEEIKIKNDKMGIDECTKCIRVLDKIKKDIEIIKNKDDCIRKKMYYFKISGVIGFILCIVLYILNKLI